MGGNASGGDPVNLVNGIETYGPEPDIVVYNPSGPDITLRRAWASGNEEAYLGYQKTIDWTLGWFDNYSVQAYQVDVYDPDLNPGGHNRWQIQYPNGAIENLYEVTDSRYGQTYLRPIAWNDYNQTWKPLNKPFYGVASADQKSLTLVFANGSKETFTADNAWERCFLTKIEDRMGHSIRIQRSDASFTTDKYFSGDPVYGAADYDDQMLHRIEYIENDTGTVALVFKHFPIAYEDAHSGHVASVTEWRNGSKRQVQYDYYYASNDQPGGTQVYTAPCLRTVTQIVTPNTPSPMIRAQYDYIATADNAFGYLYHITKQNPNGGGLTSQATINYNNDLIGNDRGKVTSLVDANRNARVYAYSVINEADSRFSLRQLHGTTVTVRAANGSAAMTYAKLWDDGDPNDTVDPYSGHYAGYRDAEGRTTRYYYDSDLTPDPNDPDKTDPTSPYYPSGRPVQKTDGQHPTRIYNPDVPIGAWDDPQYFSQMSYDDWGNVIRSANHCGLVTYYDYDYSIFPMGRLVKVVQNMPGGAQRIAARYAYNYVTATGGLLESAKVPAPSGVTSPDGFVTTSYTYNTNGDIMTVVGPVPNTLNLNLPGSTATLLSAVYDATPRKGQPRTVTAGTGSTTLMTQYTWDTGDADSYGNLKTTVDPAGVATNYTYNLANQLEWTTYARVGATGNGERSRNVYRWSGGPVQRIEFYPEGNPSSPLRQIYYTYGLEGELKSVSGSTQTTTYVYNAQYKVTSLTDGKGHVTRYDYQSTLANGNPGTGNLLKVRYPGWTSQLDPRDSISYTYDANGRVATVTNGEGVTASYVTDGYTPCGLPHTVVWSDGTRQTTDYDDFNRPHVFTSVSWDGATTRVDSLTANYDDADRVTSVSTNYNNAFTKQLDYSYYANGQRSTMGTPVGAFGYSYDGLGRPRDMTDPYQNETDWAYYYQYLRQQSVPQRFSTSFTYDVLGRLVKQESDDRFGNPFLTFAGPSGGASMQYDAADNLSSFGVGPFASGNISFGYDSRDELISEVSTRSGVPTENGFSYDNAENPTLFRNVPIPVVNYNANNQRTDSDYVYDGEGNPTMYQGKLLTFDAQNEMTSYDGMTLRAGYLGGLRLWKQSGSARKYYLYDRGAAVLEMSASGNVTFVNTFGPDGLVSRHDVIAGADTFYTFDPLGNVADRLDGDARVISHDVYDAYGHKLYGNPNNDPFGFDGQYGSITDEGTGLILMTYRYYDPLTGRFLNRDPIDYDGGMNLYGYVNNDPVDFSDPTGLFRGTCPIPPPPAAPAEAEAAAAATSAAESSGIGLGTAVARLGIIAAGAEAIVELARYKPHHPKGPFTWLGEKLGDAIFPDPPSSPPLQMARPSKRQEKADSTSCPSFAQGFHKEPNESCQQWAERVLREKGRPVKKGPGTEFNQLVKYCERHGVPW